MYKNLYGKEIARYKLDYLGGHANIDAILMNPDIIIYEKGIMISSTLQKEFIYLKWNEIDCFIYYKNGKGKIEIDYEEEGKTITLEKCDNNVNIPDILLKIKSVSSNTAILDKSEIYNASKKKNEEAFFPIDEQGLRVRALLADIEGDDRLKAYQKWENHLNKILKFPFNARIFHYQDYGSLKTGDILTIESIDSIDDLYGILVKFTKNKKHFVFPLCDLEVVDDKSKNFIPVNDYSYWFTNFR